MGCCKSKDASAPQKVKDNDPKQKPTQKKFGDYENDKDQEEEEVKRPSANKSQNEPLQVIQHKPKGELNKQDDKESISTTTAQPKNNETKDKSKTSSPHEIKKGADASKDKSVKKEEPLVEPQKLTKQQHDDLVDFAIEKITVISSKYEELAHVLRGESEQDQLEPIVESLRSANKDIQNYLDDIKSMPFQDDKAILEQISINSKTIAKIHKERLKLVKGTIPFAEFCSMVLKMLEEIGALPQQESPNNQPTKDKKSEKGSGSKVQKDSEKKDQSEKKFNESEFQDFDDFGFDKDNYSEVDGGDNFGFESGTKKGKNKGDRNQEFDNWGGSSDQNKKAKREAEVFAKEESREEPIDIGEQAYHEPGEFDPQASMMKNRMGLGQKVNKSFEVFVNNRVDISSQKPSPTRDSPDSILKQSDILSRSTFIKNAIEKSMDEEAEKIRIIKYNAEKEQAKQELEKMLHEFKKMKDELELMSEEHNNFKAEYDQAQAEVERLRQINGQFSEAAEAIIRKQMMFQEQKSILESKKKEIDNETEQMKMELINLKGYMMRSSYLYRTSNPLMNFVNSAVEKTLDKKDDIGSKRDEIQFQETSSSSKPNQMLTPDTIKNFMLPDLASTDDIVANVLGNSRATLERSRRLREVGNVVAN